MSLKCYQVHDHDFYAAESAEHALQLHQRMYEGTDEEASLNDVWEVSDSLLDTTWSDPGNPGQTTGSLREWLSKVNEPGWIAGTE
jgi:hypothetical protein